MRLKKINLAVLGFAMSLFISCKSNKKEKTDDPKSHNKIENKERPKGPPPPSGKDMFLEMDENKDGQLSKNELKGPIVDQFDTIDTDKNGFLSKEELEAARPKKPAGRPEKPINN